MYFPCILLTYRSYTSHPEHLKVEEQTVNVWVCVERVRSWIFQAEKIIITTQHNCIFICQTCQLVLYIQQTLFFWLLDVFIGSL